MAARASWAWHDQGLDRGGVRSAVVRRDVDDEARRDGWGSGEAVRRRAPRRRARDGLESELGDGEGEGLGCPFIEEDRECKRRGGGNGGRRPFPSHGINGERENGGRGEEAVEGSKSRGGLGHEAWARSARGSEQLGSVRRLGLGASGPSGAVAARLLAWSLGRWAASGGFLARAGHAGSTGSRFGRAQGDMTWAWGRVQGARGCSWRLGSGSDARLGRRPGGDRNRQRGEREREKGGGSCRRRRSGARSGRQGARSARGCWADLAGRLRFCIFSFSFFFSNTISLLKNSEYI
jgi:hypothetical protein